ncbi:MAG TPA: hypothetical protein ENH62_12795 [Marinobacter sp.]|uniref:Uncharacterized protein n=2 Tax=root TaxID=1 RepID=A0A831W1M5_9GAMM|nr:hypothetical protein [Marinobacter antarcticus]HDZ39144.1 hypothetical protein [Marinobacter sp.]HEA51572.1 hypothetical protein [Marinobacter antarcticus]
MKKLILAFVLFSGSCFAHEPEKAPELWSWFKDLDKSAAACEIQSSFALQKIGIENQVENEYGIYGTYKGNRVVVKCLAMEKGKSKVWVAVAGNDRDAVELVRNMIVKEII